MGTLKATLPLDRARSDGDTFLTRIVRSLHSAGVSDVTVVVGHCADLVIESVRQRGLSPRFVVNEQYTSGQFSSVLAALRSLNRTGIEAMLMTLVDVPLVTPSTIRAVVQRFEETGAPLVRPVAAKDGVKDARHGHPVLIARRLFAELAAASPDEGAKPIVRAHVSPQGNVEVDDEGAFVDVDTPEDYERFFRRSE
jgi:molybdenum cofactor cytidylyltransferase